MTRLSVEFHWQPNGLVGLLADPRGVAALSFPDQLGPVPGVYRLVIVAGGAREVYIGESDDVRRRGRQYRRGDGTQTTSRWVHEHLHRRLGERAMVTMDLMTAARFSIDGGPWSDTDLSRKEHRLILENAAIVIEVAADADRTSGLPTLVLNRIAEQHPER